MNSCFFFLLMGISSSSNIACFPVSEEGEML